MAPGGFPSSSGWGGVDGRDVVDVVDRARPASTRSTASLSATPSTARLLVPHFASSETIRQEIAALGVPRSQ